MNKKSLFVVLFVIFCMAVMTVSVSADQEGNKLWCNSDQYGCWVTGDAGEKNYIMFWSEAARDLFMGPGSNATVAPAYPMGEMPLDKPVVESSTRSSIFAALAEQIAEMFVAGAELMGWDYPEANLQHDLRWIANLIDNEGWTLEDVENMIYNRLEEEGVDTEDFDIKVNPEKETPASDSDGAEESNTGFDNVVDADEPILRRSAEGKTVEEMTDFLLEKQGQNSDFLKWLETATEEEIIYNYKYLNAD